MNKVLLVIALVLVTGCASVPDVSTDEGAKCVLECFAATEYSGQYQPCLNFCVTVDARAKAKND